VSIAAPAQPPRFHRRGFTLIELLLAIFLLSLLFGALVYNFSTLQPGAKLAEGMDRFESMLRFARAQAAYTGCRVQLRFAADQTVPLLSEPLYRLQLAWESNPWEHPGTFVTLPSSGWDLDGINQTVGFAPPDPPPDIESSLPLADGGEPAQPVTDPESAGATSTEEPPRLPPVTFFPDGTSDSAEFLLVARSEDDPRRVKVHLMGITGAISHEWIEAPSDEVFEEEWIDWIFDDPDEWMAFDEDTTGSDSHTTAAISDAEISQLLDDIWGAEPELPRELMDELEEVEPIP